MIPRISKNFILSVTDQNDDVVDTVTAGDGPVAIKYNHGNGNI
jgi:hypothetical protein